MNNILIVDNEPTMCMVLKVLLGQLPQNNPASQATIYEANNGMKALELCDAINFDLVLMDLSMDGMDGIETTERILEAHPETNVLVISMHNHDGTMRLLKRIGARGYLVKDRLHKELTPALETIAEGGTHFKTTMQSGPRYRPQPNAGLFRRV